jgi:hypothetical protein
VTGRRRTRAGLVGTTRLRRRVRRVRQTTDKVHAACVVKARVNSVTVSSVVAVTRITRRLVSKRRTVVVVGTARTSWPLTVLVTTTADYRDRITNDRDVKRPARILKVVGTVALLGRVTCVARALGRVVRTLAVYLDDRVAVLRGPAPIVRAVSKVVVIRRSL